MLVNDFVPRLIHRKVGDEAEGFVVVNCIEHALHGALERSVVHRVELHGVGQTDGKAVVAADERGLAAGKALQNKVRIEFGKCGSKSDG